MAAAHEMEVLIFKAQHSRSCSHFSWLLWLSDHTVSLQTEEMEQGCNHFFQASVAVIGILFLFPAFVLVNEPMVFSKRQKLLFQFSQKLKKKNI